MLGFLMSCFLGKDDRRASRVPPSVRPQDLPPGLRVIDVEGMIQQASTRVSVDQLVRKGKKYINLLSREKIDELINRCVRTIVDKHRALAEYRSAASAARIEAESRAEFEELLLQYQQTTAAGNAVEQSKQALKEEFQEARFELDPARTGVDARPSETPGTFEDFSHELDKQVLQVFEIRKLLIQRSGSPEAVSELQRVEEILRGMLSKLVQAERVRFSSPAGDVREIATLQKRMEKLFAHIATMEAALKTLSTAKTFSNQQVQNLLRELGLAQGDKNFEKKKEMLKVVLNMNQGIRRKARELAARGITLDAPEEKAVFTPVTDSRSPVFSRSAL